VYSVRQSDLLKRTAVLLNQAIEGIAHGMTPECIASDLRLAMDALGEMVGKVVTDEILDMVFKQFCIGK